MPYRIIPFQNLNFYHVYNRGVEKRQIFLTQRDYQRFLQTLYYYQFSGPKPKLSNLDRFKSQNFHENPRIIETICYCLMPNHFHLLLRQTKDEGTKEFMGKILNSYTKYFNTKQNRVGPLFQGTFKAVPIETDEQLIHVSRYIHLNPLISDLTKDLDSYPYSSYPEFIGLENNKICNVKSVLDLFKDSQDYKEFVSGHEDYAKELEIMKHLLIEEK
ncbi:MAG: transposase [Candidatus Daviesbacteria bacterium]